MIIRWYHIFFRFVQILDQTLPILEPDFNFEDQQSRQLSYTWIGHSTAVVRLDGVTILTDPIFSERASISQMIGPARYRRAAVSVKELPQINAVVISHNHYDHLDYDSVAALNKRFGTSLHWFVPLGLSQWIRDVGCANVVELDWWHQSCLPSHSDVQFIMTPAQHWSRRGAFDECKTLWGSWTIIGPEHRFFFSGDTGYCSVFEQIGQMYGPFDLAAIPIGAYEPRWFMAGATRQSRRSRPNACRPQEQTKCGHSLGNVRSGAWGQWSVQSIQIYFNLLYSLLSFKPYLEPPQKLRDALKKRNLNESQFIALSHGKTIDIWLTSTLFVYSLIN